MGKLDGKLRLAYAAVALVDLAHSADPDDLARAGLDLARLLLVRPLLDRQAIEGPGDVAGADGVGV